MLPTDQLYRDQLALMYQDPCTLSPRVIVALALLESGESVGLPLLKSCLEVSFKMGEPIIYLWILSLLKKYDPLSSTQNLGEQFSKVYAETLDPERLGHRSKKNSMIADGLEPLSETENLRELTENLRALSGYDLQVQATSVASDFSVFELPDDPYVGDLPLFSAFKEYTLNQLLNALELKFFSQGDLLIEEGEEANGVYILCYGEVEITRRTQEGETIDLAILGEGDLVGEMGLITNSPRVATATAGDDVWALVFPSAAYELIKESKEEVHAALSHLVGGRMLQNLTRFSPVFRSIPRESHSELLAEFKALVVKPGTVILEQGRPGRGLFLILDGLVRVNQLGSIIPKWLREGDIFGEISLVYDSPVSATCTAVRRSLLFTLSPNRFKELVQEYPEMRHTLTELSLFRNLDALYTLT